MDKNTFDITSDSKLYKTKSLQNKCPLSCKGRLPVVLQGGHIFLER
jgi:hypothetical protein